MFSMSDNCVPIHELEALAAELREYDYVSNDRGISQQEGREQCADKIETLIRVYKNG